MERLILYRARCDTHVYTNPVKLVYVHLWWTSLIRIEWTKGKLFVSKAAAKNT